MEKLGVPTVSIGIVSFEPLGRFSAIADGAPNLPIVSPLDQLAGLPEEEVRAKAEASIEEVISALTRPVVRKEISEERVGETEKFSGKDFAEAAEAMNRQWVARFWADGFPLVPPTAEKVNWMLTGTDRSPDDVIGVIEPGKGVATVKKIAINAVMAGCLPSYMPVLIAAVKILAEPDLDTRGIQTTMASVNPVTIINGPIAKQLNINSRFNALGGGWRANATIGRAISLMLINFGLIKPGVNDMTTVGIPIQYSYCFAEDEDESPWEPWHVREGYGKETSTVTLFPTTWGRQAGDFGCMTPECVLDLIGSVVCAPGSTFFCHVLSEKMGVLLLNPRHAAMLAGAGWSQKDVIRYMDENWRLRWGDQRRFQEEPSWFSALPPGWEDATDDTLIPVFKSGGLRTVIAGGTAGVTLLFLGAEFQKRFITQEIELPKNWEEIRRADNLPE